MKASVEVCSHCRGDLTVRFRDFEDVGFRFHWDGDLYLIDVVLFVEECRSVCVNLYGEMYAVSLERYREALRRDRYR